ncbi:MAG: hypothetical protein M1838_003074 [Thelocarpon superellum]|nr:MAG: hypothetical protein M1838_003074 [Thelocarpon superellum]
MAPSPATPARRISQRNDDDGASPLRRPKITLTDAILGRNLTPRRASKDLAGPLGRYDTNTVRDRVRQWQDQGGGVVEKHDLAAGLPEATPVVSDASTNHPAVVLGETAGRSRKARRRDTDVAPDDSASRKTPTKPKKRVLSDGHWVKTKASPPKTPLATTPKSARNVSGPHTKGDGIRVSPMTEHPVRHSREQDEENRTPPRSLVDSDGIRVYSASRKSAKHHRPERARDYRGKTPVLRSDDESDNQRPSSCTDHSPPQKKRSDSRRTKERDTTPYMSGALGQEDYGNRQRGSRCMSGTSENNPRSPEMGFLERRKSKSTTPKVSILREVYDEGKRIFSKSDSGSVAAGQGNRIEAWLSDTPDPFLDGPVPMFDPTVPLPMTPPDPPPWHLGEHGGYFADGDGDGEGAEARGSGSRRRRRARETSETKPATPAVHDRSSPSESDYGEPISVGKRPAGSSPGAAASGSPTLKRTGAMRGPTSPNRIKRRSVSRTNHFADDFRALDEDLPPDLSPSKPAENEEPLVGSHFSFKRPFPSTGRHQLSTIASEETLRTLAESTGPTIKRDAPRQSSAPRAPLEQVPEAQPFDPTSLQRELDARTTTGLKRRLTTHPDLISVLSLPQAGSKSIRSARSIRSNRTRLATATLADVMTELATEEDKYIRELNTLVDGVIPVLLTCVLSKSDSAVAAGLFNPTADSRDDPSFTRPIVDMGIALERLKSSHKRLPRDDPQQFLHWAQGAQKVYKEYLRSWRMGFQDVVVNLAPADPADPAITGDPSAGENPFDGGLPRNAEGDVINGEGERVDVAFLLKRPLVRIKYLAKTLKGINLNRPSPTAEEQAARWQILVADARQRSNEEKARLEDEAAANIDSTRARDPRTLAPLAGVSIDRTRHVRARDYFSLDLPHSSGQRLDCKIEVLLRDGDAGRSSGGDLLICEVDPSARWLLFPPITTGCYSARNGDLKGEIVLMIRGSSGPGHEWRELLSLQTDDEQVGFEWVQMLGLTPVPPSITRRPSFVRGAERLMIGPEADPASPVGIPQTPSPREIEIPIGARPLGMASKAPAGLNTTPDPHRDNARRASPPTSPVSPPSRRHSHLEKGLSISPPSRKTSARQDGLGEYATSPRDLNDAMMRAGGSGNRLKRTKARRYSRQGDGSPTTPKSSRYSGPSGSDRETPPSKVASDGRLPRGSSWSGRQEPASADASFGRTDSPHPPPLSTPSQGGDPHAQHEPQSSKSLPDHGDRRTSSVPTMDLPPVSKLRKKSAPEPVREDGGGERTRNVLRKRTARGDDGVTMDPEDRPPAPPPHRIHSPVLVAGSKTPKLPSPGSGKRVKSNRRPSSPLKREYEPSSASDSAASEDSATDRGEESSMSSDDELEDGDVPTPLVPLGTLRRLTKGAERTSTYSPPNDTVTPSQSASQAPYKTVPAQPLMGNKTVASMYSWSDSKGSWNLLHPDECSIVVSPGLIQAYEMTAAHSKPVTAELRSESDGSSAMRDGNERPLVAMELTPLVPLRRGTALDISIKSPPTAHSTIRSGNHVMFRSRNPEECEALYGMINIARINNPTYNALERARGPYGGSMGTGMSGPTSSRSGWWGWGGRKNSYRASSRGVTSLATSESSVGTVNSAFSALRRFGGGRSFNIARSSVGSRGDSRSDSVYTSSSNSSLHKDGSDSPSDPSKTSAPIGLSNARIRLYQRETASKWRDMGTARLSITAPPAGFHRHGSDGRDKRILVNGKTAGEPLLDVCLGEGAFERVGRTGIACIVWEEIAGPNGELGQVGAVGGVGARTKVYMIQMKSEADAAYTFSLVGKFRY